MRAIKLNIPFKNLYWALFFSSGLVNIFMLNPVAKFSCKVSHDSQSYTKRILIAKTYYQDAYKDLSSCQVGQS